MPYTSYGQVIASDNDLVYVKVDHPAGYTFIELHALQVSSGVELWYKKFKEGFCLECLELKSDDDKVFVQEEWLGRCYLVALDKKNGSTVWENQDIGSTHPIMVLSTL